MRIGGHVGCYYWQYVTNVESFDCTELQNELHVTFSHATGSVVRQYLVILVTVSCNLS